ncbi:hypothetical protein BSKO_05339 [Bryopsis sp. KO-2023]|nr:hypothetical protein BSKO_05339 [Bryopsis sp. KO-2023]
MVFGQCLLVQSPAVAAAACSRSSARATQSPQRGLVLPSLRKVVDSRVIHHTPSLSEAVRCNATVLPTPPVVSAPAPAMLTPAETYEKIVQGGIKKANTSASKTFIMAIVGGMFISFGALLALSVGFSCPGMLESNVGAQKILLGMFGLPFGLFLVMNTGVELFTGNTALLTAAVLEGKATTAQLTKNWICSYFGNFVGALLCVWCINTAGLTATANPAIGVATAKTSLTFMQAFIRGILANWLVCVAVWMATAASSMSGKVLGIFIPISSFVAMGFEHSIANMFFIPFGITCGAGMTMAGFCASNLIPVTLGNIVGGAFCLATMNSLFFGKLGGN